MVMKIGKTNMDSGNFVKRESWFVLKPNTSNPYRILPPLFSMVDSGNRIGKFYATHKIFLKDPATGKFQMHSFNCIEDMDRKTNIINQHCPWCDQARDNLAKYDEAKKRGVDKEQLNEFFTKKVLSLQAEKKYYVNAVNLESKTSVLSLPIKAFHALLDRIRDIQEKTGLDVTGIKGFYLDFKKSQKFKGDRDTVYTVDKYEEQVNKDGELLSRMKPQEMTDEFCRYLEGAARDIGSLFRSIPVEDMSALLTVSEDGKKALVDRIFARPEKDEDAPEQNPLEARVPNTNSIVVGRIEAKTGTPELVAPDAITHVPPQTQKPAVERINEEKAQVQAPVQQAVTAPVLAPKPVVAAPADKLASVGMSDEDFMATFMQGLK